MRAALKFLPVLAVSLVAVVVTGGLGSVFGLLDLHWPGDKTVDRSQPVLLTSIQDVERFTAAVGNFEVVVDLEDDSWLPGILKGERRLFVTAASVNAYVDFSGLTDRDLRISEADKTVVIKLPEAELENPNLLIDQTRLVDTDRGILTAIGDALSTDDQQPLYAEAEDKITAAATESGLKEQALENTQAFLTGFCKGFGYTVTFVDDFSALDGTTESPTPTEGPSD